MIKIMKEENLAASQVTVDVNDQTVPDYLQRITQAIRSEQGAIAEYDAILQSPDLPPELVEVIAEIQNDEKDHAVNLSAAVKNYMVSEFPDNTDELSDIPNPEEHDIPEDTGDEDLSM